MRRFCVVQYVLMTACLLAPDALALNTQEIAFDPGYQEAILALGSKSRKDIKAGIEKLGSLNRLTALPALKALGERRLRVDRKGNIFILGDDKTLMQDALTGEHLLPADRQLRTPKINNAVRRLLVPVIAQFELQSEDRSVRLSAAKQLSQRPRRDAMDALRTALDREKDEGVRSALLLALAQLEINSHDPQRRMESVRLLGQSGDINFKSKLQNLLNQGEDGTYAEPDAKVRNAAKKAIKSIDDKQFLITQTGNLFYGVSLGSVLLLVALGLAVTFGLMGVINMAHGEMLMLGAYATYVVQNLFQAHLPALFDWYLLAAVPAAFLTAALVGVVLERVVIRHLYARPLETLLATWGVSLIIIQTVRLCFGAQNVEVANPGWLSGGVTIMQGLVLSYSRVAIIIFSGLVVFLVWLILQRTRLGLQVRAVTQNRPMAASMGIATSQVDMWTFGLGCGIAGLGGVALSQLTNVGPELGQLYIVDSFMVVVLGGVGKIVGTVFGALGLGIVNKFLEPVSGAVLGKIFVLIFVILFIQKRPQGMFALKGRVAES